MRQVVRDNFFKYSAEHEGFTPFMYCDVLNLVTTGIGNLIDAGPNNPGPSTAARARLNNVVSQAAMQPALNLEWFHKGPGWGSKNPVTAGVASQQEVIDAWTRTKRQNELSPDFSQRGGFAYAGLTDLTLSMDGLKTLFNKTLTNFDATLSKRYLGYENWPADAQFALLSMSWAMGPAFNFPSFKAAVDRLDFAQAAVLSFFKGGGGSLDNRAGRNKDNELMFNNAAAALKGGADLGLFFFPGSPGTSAGKSADGSGTPATPGDSSNGSGNGPGASSGGGIGTGGSLATRVVIPAVAIGAIGYGGWGLYQYADKQGWVSQGVRKVKGWFR